ncbi:Sterol desaturase/sphingolipid hydroxylase, fatty acid hydroxylase superfamily [Reichenbachiella faecimaris]|uniref:Sterol desaturase/sphingolipid hydroxylase, fatty acid hydroxylase superfamily n=1 Tax=Reichenbachiella faecimaris TaxID=692418 RepID=A0A1W2GIJ0_REIFA|nr:sterol desaturase family protein [Reichenbachiella faecimaris]SMD36096.1 Sterol desaturase/sphingolipid hydroxylase, fatty acid hydroxylase superfamily [Reichenbachiella faecimaris]
MEAYAKAVLYIIPVFLLLMAIEVIYGMVVKKNTFRSFDTITGISSGITNSVKDLLGLTLVIIAYSWLYEKMALIEIKSSVLVYLICFICIDFSSYWIHRLRHHINYFWNEHVVHHSSEEFNMACALRQSISSFFGIYSVLLIPAALLGVPPKVIAIVSPIHLFLQFWYHTRHIPKLGFLEYIIVTPSQHRVHHAINPIYLDKNLAAIFCIWDRAFGTFQEELEEEPCVYGVKKAPKTWNPILINFQHLWLLIKDAWRTNSWLDKLRIWFMPLGWRPEDIKDKYPIDYIDDPKDQVKYDTEASSALHIWSWIQLVMTHLFLILMLINFGEIGFPNLFIYGAFLFIHIYAYSALMDLKKSAVLFEAIKCVGAIYWVLQSGDWFGLNGFWAAGSMVVMAYLLVSMLITMGFAIKELTASNLVAKAGA